MVIYLVVAVRRKAIESSHFQLPNSNLVVLWTSVCMLVNFMHLTRMDNIVVGVLLSLSMEEAGTRLLGALMRQNTSHYMIR